MGNAFHKIAVAAHYVNLVVYDFAARFVEGGGKPLFSHGHTYGVSYALPQRPGSSLYAQIGIVLGVAGALGPPLPEAHQVFYLVIKPGQVKTAVEEHRAVAAGENESVSVDPAGIFAVIVHNLSVKGKGYVSHAHRKAGMAGFGFFYTVNSQTSDGIGRQLVNAFAATHYYISV